MKCSISHFTGEMDSLDTSTRPPAVLCTAFAASPPLAHGTTRNQRRHRQNLTMSSA